MSVWKIVVLCVTLFSTTPAANVLGEANGRASKWAGVLKGLSYVESRNDPRAVSWMGARHGRGKYQISEIVLEHSKWRNWHDLTWRNLTPDDLFSPTICAIIARDQLEYLERYYADKPDPLPWILSAYWQGARATDEKGIAWGYVQAVRDAM